MLLTSIYESYEHYDYSPIRESSTFLRLYYYDGSNLMNLIPLLIKTTIIEDKDIEVDDIIGDIAKPYP